MATTTITPMQELFKRFGHLLPDVEKEFLEKEEVATSNELYFLLERFVKDLNLAKMIDHEGEEEARGVTSEMINSFLRTEKKLAKLTPEEDKAWENFFTYYLGEGKTDSVADELTWKDMQTKFPRLKNFEGIKDNG